MTNVLIRGLSEEVIKRIDAEAAELGLSRNEFLRRKLEGESAVRTQQVVTRVDWQRSADLFIDLADPAVMDDAWR